MASAVGQMAQAQLVEVADFNNAQMLQLISQHLKDVSNFLINALLMEQAVFNFHYVPPIPLN